MADLLIVLSGPKTVEQQARTALAAAGYPVRSDTHNHGLSDSKEEKPSKRSRQAISFITVEADDPTPVRDCVASLGYVLRLHREQGPSPEPPLGETLARMQTEINELQRGNHGD